MFDGGGRVAWWDYNAFSFMVEVRGDQSNGSAGQNAPRTSHTEIGPERFAVKIPGTQGGTHTYIHRTRRRGGFKTNNTALDTRGPGRT